MGENQPRLRCGAVSIGLIVWAVFCRAGYAAEYISAESPAPASAGALDGPLDHAFSDKPISDRLLLTRIKARLEDRPALWRDAKVEVELRTFDFDRRNSSTDKREALATGGQFSYESGRWNNLGARVALYNSIELQADGGETGLLARGHENIGVIGEANLSYEFTNTILEGSVVRLYRQTLDLPYLNKHDIRMLPATHEGYTITRDSSSLGYVVGHLTRFKDFDSEEFVSMSEAAGAQRTHQGVTVVGARFPVDDRLTIGAVNFYGWDTFNTFYAEATYHTTLKDNLDVRLSGQFTDQRSVGDELVGEFDTNHLAARVALGWRGAVVRIAASVTSDHAGIRAPWGGRPTYLGLQRLDFDRANEKSVLLGLSYNTAFFSNLGLSSYINVARGSGARDPETGVSRPDRTEYDLTVDWKPPDGLLKGLWVRARYARLDIQGDGETVRDVRIIVNYSIPFL
jgi:hypothetical protein